jgi:hypothetical protein
LIGRVPSRSVSLLAAFAALTACGGDGTTAPPPAPTTGALVIGISGLPSGLTPSFQLVAADGAQRTATAGDTVRNLAPGTLTIRPSSPRVAEIGRWMPFRETFDATIIAGQTTTQAISFLAAPIVLRVDPAGLPSSAIAPVRFTAPDGTSYNTTAGAPFLAPVPGAWTLAGLAVLAADYSWSPTAPPVTRTVLPGDTAIAIVSYEAVSGAVVVSTSGLDAGVRPRFTLRSGAQSFERTGDGVFANVPPGTWELTAQAIAVTGFRFTPDLASQVLTVTAGSTANAAVSYVSTPVPTNFEVESAYLTQAVQTRDGLTPLVAGRDALLRVFLRASTPNDWQPMVRATLLQGTNPLETFDIPAAAVGVDTLVNEGDRRRTWNVRIPGALIVPGLRLLVHADPDRTVAADGDPDDNVWPRGGVARAIDVRALAPWRAVLVPIVNNDLTGNVSVDNLAQFTTGVRRVMPMHEVDIRVREPYTSSAAALQSNDANGGWLALLAEMNAVRALDRSAPDEYYYGVVRVTYTSGIAGYGYVPGRAAVGWDYQPSGDLVAAHEWGHNFGRRHSPCGGVSNADPSYPHAGGLIGSWGWNPDTDALVTPAATDIMGYCGNQWVSAFTWTGALQYRDGTPNAIVARQRAAASSGGLLVWGTLRDGRITLEPAFHLPDHVAVASDEPASDVMLQVEALDVEGRRLASAITPAPRVDHATGDARQFAIMLPLTAAQHEQLATLRVHDVRSPLVAATRRQAMLRGAQVARALGDDVAVTRRGRDTELTWNDARVAGAIVRDPTSGRVLGIVRGATGRVRTIGDRADVIVSDGVRSRIQRIHAR